MFERPEYAVLGKRQYDQSWIDGNVEAGVGACGWARPEKRPPALDAPGGRAAPQVQAKPVKRPGVVRRAVGRVLHRPPPGEVAPVPPQRPFDLGEPPLPATIQPAAVEPEPEPEPPPAPKPQEPVDELLSPASPVPSQPPKKRCILGGVFCR